MVRPLCKELELLRTRLALLNMIIILKANALIH